MNSQREVDDQDGPGSKPGEIEVEGGKLLRFDALAKTQIREKVEVANEMAARPTA